MYQVFVFFIFKDYLKTSDIFEIVMNTIESEKKYLTLKLSESSSELITFRYIKSEYFENCCLVDYLIHFVLNLNKKFMQPEDNLVSKWINSNYHTTMFKYLSEITLNLFNLESKK